MDADSIHKSDSLLQTCPRIVMRSVIVTRGPIPKDGGHITAKIMGVYLVVDDPCDDCTHWIPSLPKLGKTKRCVICEESIPCGHMDRFARNTCNECAKYMRESNPEVSDCCGAAIEHDTKEFYCTDCGLTVEV